MFAKKADPKAAKVTSKETDSDGPKISKTGGQIDACVVPLLASVQDKTEATRAAMIQALHDLGVKQPELVLSSAVAFLIKKGGKIDTAHRVTILHVITQILEDVAKSVSLEVAKQLIDFSANEMVASEEVKPDVQGPASQALVLLAGPFCSLVLDKILEVFPAGTVPHYYVMKTLADVAGANGVEFTLRIRDVVTRVIPCLGSVKKSPIKWVFSTALGRFAIAMREFNEKASGEQKVQVNTANYASEMVSGFDVLFEPNWLLAKEPKVRFAVAEALGYLCSALDSTSCEERLPKLITTYLTLYKKEKPQDHLAISQGLAATLATSMRDPGGFDSALLLSVFTGLHPMLCKPPDTSSPSLVKNHHELLKCFEVVARELMDATLNFVINRFQLKEAGPRTGSLIILQHFVETLDDVLADKKPLLMSAVINLISENEPGLKKHILALVDSMSKKEYLHMEGGQQLVRFVVALAAKEEPEAKEDDKKKEKAPEKGEKGATAAATTMTQKAAQTLLDMTTDVASTKSVLWPFLLELFVEPSLKGAYRTLVKCLSSLAANMRAANDPEYLIDFKANVNVPSRPTILSRLMIMASVPFAEGDQGQATVECMSAIGPVLGAEVGTYWDQGCPALLKHLEQAGPDMDVNKWQESLLRMFKQTLNVIPDEGFKRDLCQDLCKAWPLYSKDADLMRVTFRFLGAVVAVLDSKALVGSTIDDMLERVDHTSDLQRQGLAQGLGLAGNAKLDVVLPKLTARLGPKEEEAPKKGFLASIMGGGKPKGPGDGVKATILLAYGYITAYANPELLLSRLDVHVLHNILPILATAAQASNLLKVNMIKSIDLVGKALHSSRLPAGQKNWTLQQRNSLIKGLLAIMDASGKQAPTYELRLLGLNAMATLVNLSPPIDAEIRDQLFNTVLPLAVQFPEEEQPKEGEEAVPSQLLDNVNTLLSAVIQADPAVPTLIDILKRLQKWVVSEKPEERERACQVYLVLMKSFVAKLVQDKAPMQETCLPLLGELLAGMAPRCSDTTKSTRKFAAENVQILLYVDQLLENPGNPKPVQEIKLITDVRNRLEVQLVDRLPVLVDLAGMICAVMTVDELMDFELALLSGLSDPDADAARGATELAKGVFTQKGVDFAPRIEALMKTLIAAVGATLQREQVCNEVLGCMRVLCKDHFKSVLTCLLESPVPLTPEVSKCFQALVNADNQKLALDTIKYFFTILNDTPMDTKAPNALVMTATCALTAIMPTPSVRPLIAGSYAALFCSLLMRVGTASGVDEGASSKDAVAALKVFLEANGEERMLELLSAKDVWAKLLEPNYDDAMTTAASVFCEVHGDLKRSLLKFLAKFYSQQSYEGQRVVATAILAEFVNHSSADPPLLKELVKFLLPRVADKIVKVRKQALRGLGNLVSAWTDEISESAASVVSALTSASEDADAEVAAEATSSLTRIVGVVDEDTIGPMLINICFRMRPAFDRKTDSVRAAAFTLFGALCRFGQSHKEDPKHVAGLVSNFIDQVHTNLPIFIVHLLDDSADVRKACHDAFKRLADLIDADVFKVVSAVDPQTLDFDPYVVFLTEICPVLGAAFPERLRSYVGASVEYFASSWTGIRGNACLFSALLVASASEEHRRSVNTNGLCTALVKLLSQTEPIVRSRAAKAISLLHEI